ncbi:MAG: DUF547 domain-containing protein [Planctomycetaceae bacterium]
MRRYAKIAVFSGIAVGIMVTTICYAGSAVMVGVDVSGSKQVPVEEIRHESWDRLLRKHVDKEGYVNYPQWKASAADQKLLGDYLNYLSAAKISRNSSRESQLAFWINAYNALTVKRILREYPTSSIRNHTAKVVGYNIWKDLQLLVAGKPYSLEAIEHQILRKMNEPRIHFAIVCASVGCPRLLNEAYVAERLEEQLSLNAKHFFADRSKFSADTTSGVIHISPILDWFANDFGKNTSEQMRAISPYVPDSAQRLTASGKARVKYLDYDWSLNDQARR